MNRVIGSTRFKAVLTLLLLSPAIPELLTGSTPFWAFINPINLAVLIVIYGFTTLLLRDYCVIRGYNYEDLLLLGAVMGLLVEGLAVNTFYDNRIEKLGDFATYGRFLDINWNWAVYLVIFHSIWSVVVPVMITESLYPSIRGETLTTSKQRVVLIACIGFVTILFNLSDEVYKPNPLYQLFTLALLVIIPTIYDSLKQILHTRFIKLIPGFPVRYLILYPVLLIILSFYILSRLLPPLLHIIVGIALYIMLYNTLRKQRTSSETWMFSSRLLLGLCIMGLMVALLDNQYHIIVPAIFFTISTLILSKKLAGKSL